MAASNNFSYTVYVFNCPNTEKYRVNKIAASPDMNFIEPIFSVLGQLYIV
jgi:hypothetical protein